MASDDFTTQAKTEPTVVAGRLHYLEQVVKNMKPGEGGIDKRIYELTDAGSVLGATNVDWSLNRTVIDGMPTTSAQRSLFASIFGQQFDQGLFNIRVQNMPFYDGV